MKKNRWASIDKLLQMSVLASLLLLSSLSGITPMAMTHAMSPKCSRHPQLCTPTPTPIAPPPPNMMPTLQVQPYPTRGVLPVLTPTAGTLSAATPTASAIATAVPVPANQSTDSTLANQQLQGRTDQGFTLFLLFLGVGVSLFLLSGAMLWFMWRRQTDQHQPALQGMSHHVQASRWMSSHRREPSPNASEYASSAILAPGVSGGAPLLGSTEPMLSPQLAETPNSPGSVTTTFPRHMLTMSSNNAARSPHNDESESLLMDILNLPLQQIEARESNKNGHMPPLAPPSTAWMDTPTQSILSPLLVPPVVSGTVRPPAIKDDPMLERVMRQAQMGLFALSGR